MPWPVRRGGAALWLYENSLSFAFVLLFLASWLAHAALGAREYSAELVDHGGARVSTVEYMTRAQCSGLSRSRCSCWWSIARWRCAWVWAVRVTGSRTSRSEAVAAGDRLSGEATFPAGAQDVKAAVRWLRANAATYGLDPDHIGAWGQSAGGWIANLLGATGDQATVFDDGDLGNEDQSSAVQAVVSWFGPTDFTTMDEQAADSQCAGQSQVHGTADSPESAWLGAPVATSAMAEQTDISAYVDDASTLPAWYLAHGDADCNVPGGQSTELADALDAAGADVTYVVLPGADHMDPAFDREQLRPTLDFLADSLQG